MASRAPALPTKVAQPGAVGVVRPADQFMRKLLRVSAIRPTSSTAGAHRAFRVSVIISGIRCVATYLLVPVLVPVMSFAGVLAAPLGIVLCIVAVVSGIAGVRRFWIADHRAKWMYTWFMVAVFGILGIALIADISRLVAQL